VAVPRPASGVRWLFSQTQTYDILIATFAAVIGVSSAANYAAQGRPRTAAAVGVATLAVLIATFIKQAIALGDARRRESVHELEGCLYTLHAVLDPSARDPPVTVRLAVHVPVGDMLEQVTEYIGVPPRAGRRGRRYSANAGIIGRAFRENVVLVAQRASDDYESYVHELVRDWNFTESQARHLNPAVMEWMAVPLFDTDRGRVEAVLYLDSTRRDFFDDTRQELVLSAVNGIAVFIGKRYSQQ
jgi:hypothetical protein